MGGLHTTMIDEEEKGGFLDVIICIRSPARSIETPTVIGRSEFDKLIGHTTTMYLSYAIYSRCLRLDRDRSPRVAMLLTREGNALAVNGITSNHIDNLVVLVRSRPEGPTTRWDIVEQVFYG